MAVGGWGVQGRFKAQPALLMAPQPALTVRTCLLPQPPCAATPAQSASQRYYSDVQKVQLVNFLRYYGEGVLVFALEQVEVVGGGYSDDVFLWVPCGVQDFLVEV